MPYDPDTRLGGVGGDRFPSTRPSLLAGAGASGRLSDEALGEIIAAYWKPVYKYVRRKWNGSNDQAKDLTQGFFASLIERGLLGRFDPSRASFRTYLRTCVDGFVMNEAEAAGRLKRGGGQTELMASLDFDEAGREFEIADPGPSPEEYFFREWRREMFGLAIGDLRRECEAAGKGVHYRLFEQYDLCGDTMRRPTYSALAAAHGLAETTVTNHLAFARRRLRQLLLDRLAGVTSGEHELQQEARGLLGG